ncbi:MAG: single-stranded DNA-binding protein [Methylacidiphilales bacterium]|nr:single-stranded DNA-binding protein [Candidatus Methylacidiphilales bacterium]
MASLNKVFLIGNLTRDPEIRHTPKGTAVGDLAMAMNMVYRGLDGTEKEEVCYVDVVVWGRQAETCKEYLSKGSPIFVEGRLQLDQWETQQGEKRSRLRVRAERVQFLGRGGGGSGGSSGGSSRSSAERDSGHTSSKVESEPASRPGRESEDIPPPDAADDEIPF